MTSEDSAHSELPPSSADKWFPCPGWLKLNRGIESTSSVAAEEGTLAHLLLEQHLTGEKDLKTLDDPVMHDYLMSCVDWVTDQVSELSAELYSEARIDFGEQFGYVGLTGTSDLVLDCPDLLVVGDLKYGRGLVEVENNLQLMTYLSGAVHKFGPRPNYRLVILQPRGNHFDGPIRSWDVSPEALAGFNLRLEAAIASNYSPSTRPVAGPHCRKYCAALGRCPAAATAALSLFRSTPLDA